MGKKRKGKAKKSYLDCLKKGERARVRLLDGAIECIFRTPDDFIESWRMLDKLHSELERFATVWELSGEKTENVEYALKGLLQNYEGHLKMVWRPEGWLA